MVAVQRPASCRTENLCMVTAFTSTMNRWNAWSILSARAWHRRRAPEESQSTSAERGVGILVEQQFIDKGMKQGLDRFVPQFKRHLCGTRRMFRVLQHYGAKRGARLDEKGTGAIRAYLERDVGAGDIVDLPECHARPIPLRCRGAQAAQRERRAPRRTPHPPPCRCPCTRLPPPRPGPGMTPCGYVSRVRRVRAEDRVR